MLLGLYVFLICLSELLSKPTPQLFTAGPLSFIGFVIFRGGIHLLKVAVAARICMQTQAEVKKQSPVGKREKADALWDW